MIKSVSRSTGLTSFCLIVALIVPLIQCLPVDREQNSMDRFKRNTVLTDASAQSNAKAQEFAIFPPVLQKYISGGLGSGGLSGAGLGGTSGSNGVFGILDGLFGPASNLVNFGLLKPTTGLLNGVVGVGDGLTGSLANNLPAILASIIGQSGGGILSRGPLFGGLPGSNLYSGGLPGSNLYSGGNLGGGGQPLFLSSTASSGAKSAATAFNSS